MNPFSDQNPYESPVQAELVRPDRPANSFKGPLRPFPIFTVIAFVICLMFALGNYDRFWFTGRDPVANAFAFSFGTAALLLFVRLLRWTFIG